jgi:hypothetical protein
MVRLGALRKNGATFGVCASVAFHTSVLARDRDLDRRNRLAADQRPVHGSLLLNVPMLMNTRFQRAKRRPNQRRPFTRAVSTRSTAA